MSYATMKWAMEVQATPTQKHVLLVLATHANEDGEAFPSIQSVCNATGLSDRAVRKARSELIEGGLLEKSRKFTRNGVRLNMARYAAQPAPDAGKAAPRSEKPAPRATKKEPAPDAATPARHAAQPAPDAGPHNSQLNTINSHIIPPTPQPRESTASKPKAAIPKIDLPDWMPLKAWDGWLEMRRGKKCPATTRALELAVKKLADLRAQGHDPEVVLDQSTMMGWQGLFPVKPDRSGQLPHNVTPFPRPMSPAEQNRRGSIDRIRARQEALRNAQ